MNIFIQTYNTNFLQCPCPQNPSQNSPNNITNYQHYQNSMSHQHCPNYTIINQINTTLQKCSKAKITTWSIIKCPKFQLEHTTKWQCLTIKLSMKHGNNIFPNKETKEKITLKSMWECGVRSWGLEEAPPHHSIQMMDDISFHEK